VVKYTLQQGVTNGRLVSGHTETVTSVAFDEEVRFVVLDWNQELTHYHFAGIIIRLLWNRRKLEDMVIQTPIPTRSI